MRRIIINEYDNTSNLRDADAANTNMVYIPGFSNGEALQERGPVILSSLGDLEAALGTLADAPKFAKEQLYPVASEEEVGERTEGFPLLAIPDTNGRHWFSGGDIDPSYIYARSVVGSGLTVVYEPINKAKPELHFQTGDIEEINPFFGIAYREIMPQTSKHKYNFVGMVAQVYQNEWKNAINNIEVSDADKALLTKWIADYEEACEEYPVTVNNAYEYMASVAFNGKIETEYWEEYDKEGKPTGHSQTEIKVPASAILNKNEYDVKYLTSGGYPVFEHSLNIADLMINTASWNGEHTNWGRGDCIALIDHTNNPHRPLEGKASVFKQTLPNSDYAAMFTPWCVCTNGYEMPGSYVYLNTFANSLRANPSWMSVAGVARGVVSCVTELNTDRDLTNRIAESYQYGYSLGEDRTCINAITFIKNYGYTIWGNRTLKKYDSGQTGFATSFLNTRTLVCDVKKVLYNAAKSVMFEVNNDILWDNYKSLITPTLDSMVAGYGLKTYAINRLTSNDKTKLYAQVILYPTYCVESVVVNIDLQDDDSIVVSEEE